MLLKQILFSFKLSSINSMPTKFFKSKATTSEGGALALEISNLGGVFLVLIGGCIFGMFVSISEMLIGVKERCDENKVLLPTVIKYSLLFSYYLIWLRIKIFEQKLKKNRKLITK